MKKILGLDLGVNSIGWAVVNESDSPSETSSIISAGVRIVPLTVDEKSNFEKGKAITTNADRRMKRGMRRNLQRYKLRREKLVKTLKDNGLLLSDSILSENGNNTTFQTYQLRAKAATQEISLEELSRVFLMINKKRGYKSNRKAKGEDEGAAVNSMDLAIRMYETGLTPGQICLEILQKGRTKLPDFYQSDLKVEFDRIWEEQKKHYPEILTDALKDEVFGRPSKQTFAILAKSFTWTGNEKIYDEKTGEFKIVEKQYKIEGAKRTTKGIQQKIENYSWRSKALTEKLHPEEIVYVLQDINSQIGATSGYLGKISDRSKQLYLNHITIGQLLWQKICKNSSDSLKNTVFYRQDYMDEFDKIWETQAKYHKELTPELKHEIRDVIIFHQRPLKSQKGLISICELEQRELKVKKNGKEMTKIVGNRVIPKSHPLFQEFRIWQTLNNIEVSLVEAKRRKRKAKDMTPSIFSETEDMLEFEGHRSLYPEEMATLANELSIKEHLTKQEIIKLLFDGRKDVDLNFDKVMGNATMHSLYRSYSDMIEKCYGYDPIDFKLPAKQIREYFEKVFSADNWEAAILNPDITDDIRALENNKTYKLWHLLYSYEGDSSKNGDEKLIAQLSEKYNIPTDAASILANTTFENDYGNLSAKAISKILPFLKEGNTYDVSCAYAGYNHSRQSITSEENEKRELSRHLENLPLNSLRNPVVEKILNQMVNVVNALTDAYGNTGENGGFDEIRVELARELKKNAKEREDLAKAIRDNDAENQRIREVIKKDFNIANVSRNDIIRYKLYQELEPNGFKTLYSNTYIPYEKIFDKEIDIEHIIPQARLFDDSISNKTLEYRSVNLAKGKTTAYDYVKQTYGDAGLEAYELRCRNCFADKKAKLRKLLMPENEIPEGFIDRDLRQTQYISRKALSMLTKVCRSVVATTGSITERLRKDWQLIDVMKEINLPKYAKLGMVTTTTSEDGHVTKKIEDWTKRNDHRHHAMDALTVAFTRRAFIQFLNNRNAQWDDHAPMHDSIMAINQKYFKNGIAVPPMPLDALRAESKRHLENILVSIKAKNKVTTISTNRIKTKTGDKESKCNTPRGALHKETVYGIRNRYVKKEEAVSKNFDEAKIATVAKKRYRDALMARLLAFGGDPEKAFSGKNALSKNPIFLDEKQSMVVPPKVETVTLERYYTIRKPIGPDINIDNVVDAAVREALKERLNQFGGDAKKAFVNIEENPILLHGKPLKRVTLVAKVDTGTCLHDLKDKDGNLITDSDGNPIPTDFVKSDENHHVAIFRRPKLDKNGNQMLEDDGSIVYEWTEHIVSFMEAVIRTNNGMPVVDKSWGKDQGWDFVFSLKKNEYFVFPGDGFDPHEVDLMDPQNAAEISKHLFRVQQVSSMYYVFRHHLETTVTSSKELMGTTWLRINALKKLSSLEKVRLDHLGRIVAIGEY